MMNLSRSTSLKTHKGHLTDVFPWVASQLIKKDKNLKVLELKCWCMSYNPVGIIALKKREYQQKR